MNSDQCGFFDDFPHAGAYSAVTRFQPESAWAAIETGATSFGRQMSANTQIKRSKVCYLDFDGVLHSSEVFFSPHLGIHMREPGRALFEWAPILVELLEPHPEVSIVLSTSWVGEWGEEFARGVLPPSLQGRVVGSTYSPDNLRYFDAWSRGRQVTSDAQSRKPDSWFAIDDDDRGWSPGAAGRLVLTDGLKGISSVESQNAIRRALVSL